MSEPIIEVRNVHKHFTVGEIDVHALQGVNLSIQHGEMVAVMGPSGCGKTTLLNCLSGLDSFDRGEILIEGQSLARLNDRQRTTYRAANMGFVFQTYNLLPVISALENVELALLVNKVGPSEAHRRAQEIIATVGLADWRAHRPSQLSGGQRQRVAIARALANQPAIVWADEPTGNLDEDTSREILALMRQLNQDHRQTFVIVTHDIEVGNFCDRIVHMRMGQIVPNTKSTGLSSQDTPLGQTDGSELPS